MINKKIIKQYLNQNKRLTLLREKKPILKNWTEAFVSEKKLMMHDNNLGWVLGSCDLVIDVDKKNKGEESFKKLLKFLKTNQPDLTLLPTVFTPSGGFHIYLKMSKKYENKNFRKTLKDYKGIDFLTRGSQCVVVSSVIKNKKYVWADDLFGEFEQLDAPQSILNLLSYESENEENEESSDSLEDLAESIREKSIKCSETKVKAMLDRLDASMCNEDWVKVGMALKDWDKKKGLKIWEEWSKKGENYTENETEKRWKSFTKNNENKNVTLGTLFHMNKEVDYNETIEKVNNYIEHIKFSDEKKLEFDLIPKIKKEEFNKINTEKLVKVIQDRYKEISNIRMPISNIRKMISSVEIVQGTFIEDNEKPRWCENWIYVNSHSSFINLKTLTLHKSESFNIENGKYVPMGENGTKVSASKFAADTGFVDKVDAIAYLPNLKDKICEIDGSSVLNSFNSETVPREAKNFTKEGMEAIEKVKKHIKFICTTDQDSDMFTQWLAHQVQYPGRQILWSPIVQSIQGVGKSFFGELLRSCLGDRNVGTVSPGQVVNDFNGWATNAVVNILEELRVKGHNRYDAVNALKPLITDRMIQINDKGVKQYMTYNTTNYMCFTNYKDALPLDEDDRRWWVVFVPIQSLKDLKNFVGEDAVTYFPNLFDAVRKNGKEIRKWFLEYKITDNFMNIKQAPITKDKLSMIATEDAGFEGLFEIKELIKKGGRFFNEYVISSSDLFDALSFEYPEFEIQTTKRNLLLKKLGYMILHQPLKIDGKTRRIWAKNQIDKGEARDLLIEHNENLEDL